METEARSRGQRNNPLVHLHHHMLPPRSALPGSRCGFVRLQSASWRALRLAVLTAWAATASAALLDAQTIALDGSESTPTGALRGEQLYPSLSLNSDGAIVVWEDNTIDGTNGLGIAAQRLGADLAPVSGVFRVNERLAGDQMAPQAVALSGGETLVAWQNRLGAKDNVLARLLEPTGAFLTKEFQLNQVTTSFSYRYKVTWDIYNRNRYRKRTFRLKDTVTNIRELSGQPVVGALPDGGAVVVYQSARRHETNSWGLTHVWRWTGSRNLTNSLLVPTRSYVDWMLEIYFQRVSATGDKVGPEVLVNQYSDYNQRSPALAVLPDGKFVVAWVSEHPRSFIQTDNFQVDLYARLFSSQGEPLGNEFRVNGTDGLTCANPTAAPLATGGFTVAWSQQESALSRHWDVASRIYDANGLAAGAVALINITKDGDQFGPKIAAVGDNQLVIWTSRGQDGSREGVYGRLLYGGAPAGDEFRVNTTTASRQIQPAVAGEAHGRFLAMWSSYAGESGFDLAAQSYVVPSSLVPAGGGGLVDNQALPGEALFAGAGASIPSSFAGSGASLGNSVRAPAHLPLQLNLTGPADKRRLLWNSEAGARYQVETSTDLETWTVFGGPRTASGTTDSVGLSGGEPAAFYRVTRVR